MKPQNNSQETKYFLWLVESVERGTTIPNWETGVLKLLHHIPFAWIIKKDENRRLDAAEIRTIFEKEFNLRFCRLTENVSVFEILVVMAKHMDFQTYDHKEGSKTAKYFWELIRNLGVSSKYSDLRNTQLIRDWLERRFRPNGKGSIFPLKHPTRDQRELEIWYQMMAYIQENYAI